MDGMQRVSAQIVIEIERFDEGGNLTDRQISQPAQVTAMSPEAFARAWTAYLELLMTGDTGGGDGDHDLAGTG